MGTLDGRVAIVTGGSKGIGRSVAKLFAREGAHVMCVDRRLDSAEETVRMIADEGGKAFAFEADGASLTRDNTILISGVIYRRALHAALGPFDEKLPFYWDWDWYLRVARSGHPLTHIRMPVVAIRVHAQNMSGESLEPQRRINLDRFSTKHVLPPIPLKNHLDIATQAPGKPPRPKS